MSNKGNPHMDGHQRKLNKLGGLASDIASDPLTNVRKKKKKRSLLGKVLVGMDKPRRIMKKYTHSRPSYYKDK